MAQVPQVPWLLRETPRPVATRDLAELVPPASLGLPAMTAVGEANSEQRQPLHLGASPRDQIMYGSKAAQPRLPAPMKALAERQALWILDRLEGNKFALFVGARHIRAKKSGFLTELYGKTPSAGR